MKRMSLTVLTIAMLTLCARGFADTIDFTFVGGSYSGSGAFTAVYEGTSYDSYDGLVTDSNGIWLVTGVTGSMNGDPFTGIAPVNSFEGNDNLLFLGSAQLLDYDGISIDCDNASAPLVNLYLDYYYLDDWMVAGISGDPAVFTASLQPGVIPEPSTLLLLGSGLAGLAGLVRRKTGARR